MADNQSQENRRKYPRVDGSVCKIDYKALPKENKTVYDFIQVSTAENIGGGGVSFTTTESFPISTFLQMEITIIKEAKIINAIGKVVRCEETKPGYFLTACFFVSIDKDDHMFLVDYMRSVIRDL